MKTTTKKVTSLLVLLIVMMSCNLVAAQTFNRKDINGMWKRSDGLIITISGVGTFSDGGHALVFAPGNSGWSQTCAKRCWKFRQIQYEGENQWSANNKMYMPNGDYTKDDGTVTIRLAEDKQSFTAGGFTYNKY
uniref:hypothetical protein n=1 Tax=Flavobacterium sp. TaxID=239 RepID=UPI004049445A